MESTEARTIKLARANARTLADEATPLVRNSWYVACFSHDVQEGDLIPKRLLDVNVVLYRDANGEVRALRDRCAHRSFPLSKGKLDNGIVVCGYHGFKYNPAGKCIHVPSQPDRCPAGIAVRSYPVVEMRPHIWIWMGDESQANPALIPSAPWMKESEHWTAGHGYLHAKSNYVHLHENLLDLSHLTYLHEMTFGTPDYALAPFEIDVGDTTFGVRRTVSPTRLPPMYADPTGMQGVDAARIVSSAFISPALHFTELILRNLTASEGQRRDFHLKTAHILTPESQHSLHYHFTVVRDFALEDAEMTRSLLKGVVDVFNEDISALETIARIKEGENDPDFYESSVPADRAGVSMRRYLKTLAQKERSSAPAPEAGASSERS
jgi:phenylpropionate dioxygenase-like ring-hydroxylating dioxygenase large terminal subunit